MNQVSHMNQLSQLKDKSVIVSSIWMIAVSLLLFFLPAVNGFVGGAVGGYKAGSIGRGLAAAVLPAIVVGMLLWTIFALFELPLLGFFGGLAIGVWALISSLSLLLGAVFGGAVAPDRPARAL